MSRMNKAEVALVAMARLNKLYPNTEYRRQWSLFGYDFVYTHRSKDNLWGRFGGGWQWELGFQIGGSTMIINLLISSLRISRKKREVK